MARTIGKVKIKKLKQICKEELRKTCNFFGGTDYKKMHDSTVNRVPSEWFDTWEMADQEIERIINDEQVEWSHRR